VDWARGYNFSPQKTSRSQKVPSGLRLDKLLRTTQALESKHIQNFDVSSLCRRGSLKITANRLSKVQIK
jgi:DNA topoisomerase VI subunit B